MNAVVHYPKNDSARANGSERLLRIREVEKRIGLRKSAIYNAIARGQFPAPIKILSSRSSGWLESEIDQWIDDQIKASRPA